MSSLSQCEKNRRMHLRRRPKGSAKATCRRGALDLGTNLAVRVLDVSEGGARLVVRETIDLLKEVTVTLEGPQHLRPLRIVGRVIWCVSTATSEHCIGIQFDKRLLYMDLQKLT
jgi:hypothetical protein